MKPDFSTEKKYWDKDYVVVGVDEVGRGAVAGPVVAAAAALQFPRQKLLHLGGQAIFKKILSLGVDDSKRLTRKKREKVAPLIKKYFNYGIGEATVKEINKFGIVKAARLAMKRSIRDLRFKNKDLKIKKIKILIDGRRVRGIGHQKAIIKGDQKSISIAAASIIAKVYRDKLMRELSGKYTGYGFERHVGYGTEYHARMIKKLGVCEMHRVGFVRSLMTKSRERSWFNS